MPIISDSRLIHLALDALEEAAAAAHTGPVKQTWALRLVLAFLASRASGGGTTPRWPFDSFWQALVRQRQQERWAVANAALNAIYLAVGVKRKLERVSLFEQRAGR